MKGQNPIEASGFCSSINWRIIDAHHPLSRACENKGERSTFLPSRGRERLRLWRVVQPECRQSRVLSTAPPASMLSFGMVAPPLRRAEALFENFAKDDASPGC